MSVCGFTSEPRLRRSAGVASALVLLVVAVFLVAGPTAGAKRKDHTPPTFAGLKSATTCVPGPIGGGTTTSYNLRWDAATDNVSPSSTIVYLVYQANAPVVLSAHEHSRTIFNPITSDWNRDRIGAAQGGEAVVVSALGASSMCRVP